MQTKLESFIEVALNTIIGWMTAIVTQLVVFPMFDITVSFHEQISISLIFTSIAIVRSYIIRRWFNRRLRSVAVNLAKKVE